jgi:hypothetical protein
MLGRMAKQSSLDDMGLDLGNISILFGSVIMFWPVSLSLFLSPTLTLSTKFLIASSLLECFLPYFSLDCVRQDVPVFDCSHCEGMLSDVRSGILGNQTLHTCHPCSGIVVRHCTQALVVL